MANPITNLGLSCPKGGAFYTCQGSTSQFIGCCASNPCTTATGECPTADLRYSSFNATDYAKIEDQACSGSGGNWYTCAATTEPFLGCCASNACSTAAGCANKDLVAAKLSGDKSAAAVFTSSAASTKSTASMTTTTKTTGTVSTGSSAVTSSATSSVTSSTAAASQAGGSSGLSYGAKAGIGVGCAIVAVILIGVCLFFARRCLKDRRGVVVRGSSPPTPSGMMDENHKNGYQYYGMVPSRGPGFRQALTFPDPNRILHTPPQPTTSSNQPHYTQSPGSGYAPSYAGSSPSSDAFTRNTSVRSANSNVLGIMPSPSLNGSPKQKQQQRWVGQYGTAEQYMQQSPPLGTVAELDATNSSRPASASPSASTRLPASTYRPPHWPSR